MKLHTTDLPLVINREFYDDLVENFTLIENALKDVDSLQDKVSKLQNALGLTDDDLNNLCGGEQN